MGTRRAVLAGLGLGLVLAGVRALAAVPQRVSRPGPTPGGGFDAGLPVDQVYPAEQRILPRPVRGQLLDGAAFDLAALRGLLVVINFWASWCAPCRAELEGLKAVHSATRELGVAFLGVAVRDTKAAATAFAAGIGVPYPNLHDPHALVALAFDKVSPVALPATVVLDRRGRIAAVFLRAVAPADLEPVLHRLAAEDEHAGGWAAGI